MGNSDAKRYKIPTKKDTSIKSADYKLFREELGLSRSQIDFWIREFHTNNLDGKLSRNEFVQLYSRLRSEPEEKIRLISEFVFNAFDIDRNGSIELKEFLQGYAWTSHGSVEQRLKYLFKLYDVNNEGVISRESLKVILENMLKYYDNLMNSEEKIDNFVGKIMKDVDSNGDGLITKDEFMQSLGENYETRMVMSPFN
jgi:Ca2+-binding EF-hand superfamily protein